MINIFKNQKPSAKNDQKALAKNETFQNSKFAIFCSARRPGADRDPERVHHDDDKRQVNCGSNHQRLTTEKGLRFRGRTNGSAL